MKFAQLLERSATKTQLCGSFHTVSKGYFLGFISRFWVLEKRWWFSFNTQLVGCRSKS